MDGINRKTPADARPTVIHSRGANICLQLDSLTDLNPAGSVRWKDVGKGVAVLFGNCQRETQCFPALYSSAEPKSW